MEAWKKLADGIKKKDLMRSEKLLAWEISERNNQLKVDDDFAPNLE